MVFNRIVQVVNIKLEVMQEWEKRVNPDVQVQYTQKQLQQMEQTMRVEELNLANLNMLPTGPVARNSNRSGNNSTTNARH